MNTYSANFQERLSDAISAGNIEEIKQLIAGGANLNHANEKDFTPLMQAVEAQNLEILQILIGAGANPNLKGFHGRTPLHLAVDISIDGTVQTGGDPGDEPTDLIDALLQAGAEIYTEDEEGESPFDIAVMYRSQKIIAFLKAHEPKKKR